ncbi:MAG: NADAR family protein [Agitococcus sp.]|nr:NADAR family protein [Agitococcus sp.]
MKTTNELVLFYGRSEFYSNWHATGFRMYGLPFANGEQFMMYCKAMTFGDEVVMAKILKESDPAKVKALGRMVQPYDDEKWAAVRLNLVQRGLLEKARTHPAIAQALLATGTRLLVEASPWDKIWGIGLKETDPRALNPAQWQGLNLLGQAWMWVRQELHTTIATQAVQTDLF